MEFPAQLLPNENLKLIDCDISHHHLIRHTPTKDMWDSELNLLKEKAVCEPRTRMPDLSASLLGIFEECHICINILRESDFNNYCNPNISVSSPVLNKDYVIVEDRGCWFVEISKINNQKAEYVYNSDDLFAICKVIHTPMKWNFWHFSIRWFLPNENKFWYEIDERMRLRNWSKKLAHETRSIIRKFAKIEKPISDELDKSCYMIDN